MVVKQTEKMAKKILPLIGLILLIPSLVFNLFLYKRNQNLQTLSTVSSVIDGDTFILKTGQRIRLINLSAPELEFCGGKEAKERLKGLIEGKEVKIETVSQDVFNRTLALVYLGRTLVNEVMLKEGWARYDSSPNPQKDVLLKAHQLAQENKKGLFSLCLQEKPEKEGCLIKGNVERNTNIKRYHFPGCSNYQQVVVEKDLGENWFCTEEEAQKAGFGKSPECYGKTYLPQLPQ